MTPLRSTARYAAVAFLTAGVTLACQVLVHRMVSAKLLNNFAFLVISLTMLGFAASGNYGDTVAIFEAVHGSAPKYAGKNVINPIAAINAVSMLLEQIGQEKASKRVMQAIQKVGYPDMNQSHFTSRNIFSYGVREFIENGDGRGWLGRFCAGWAVALAAMAILEGAARLEQTFLRRSLRRFKDDVREVQSGFECGIGLSDFQDLKPGDIIELPRGIIGQTRLRMENLVRFVGEAGLENGSVAVRIRETTEGEKL